ncbi:hypothetical protein MKW92_018183 [Papaver armeniacum]|nr:hypothetical protein MKW92_018183 [Papaver armeniacum]
MPQLDQFTYFTQFFWSCLLLFTFYISITNDSNGKASNGESISSKDFSTVLSYMYSSLSEVSQWCHSVDLMGKGRKMTLISCFGEISALHNPVWGMPCKKDIMLIHVLHGQGSIVL